MSSQKRKYELKARAEHQDRTRERIVAATSELHEELGPARTTVAEVARRAGVQRLTVYNHFPDDQELFAACSQHWRAAHPLPDMTSALAMEDPGDRLHGALRMLYGYYRANASMISNVQRDRHLLPALDAVLKVGGDSQIAALAKGLAAGFRARGRAVDMARAATSLALDFWTWRRLSSEGLDDDAAAGLMMAAVIAAATNQAR
jgi:AcrR family transcriptional regulator